MQLENRNAEGLSCKICHFGTLIERELIPLMAQHQVGNRTDVRVVEIDWEGSVLCCQSCLICISPFDGIPGISCRVILP